MFKINLLVNQAGKKKSDLNVYAEKTQKEKAFVI